MKGNLIYILSVIVISMMVTACSSDEPKQETSIYPSIEQIESGGVWETVDFYFVASNGQEFTYDQLLVGGVSYKINFQIKDGKLYHIGWNNAFGPMLYINVYNYKYDTATGELFILRNGQYEKYLEVISYDCEDKELIVHARFGPYIPTDMLDDTYVPNGEDTGWDTGSYEVITLKPMTSEKELQEISDCQNIFYYDK